MPELVKAHPRFVAALTAGKAGEWRFRFKSKDDDGRFVTVHVFLFNLFVTKDQLFALLMRAVLIVALKRTLTPVSSTLMLSTSEALMPVPEVATMQFPVVCQELSPSEVVYL